MRDAPIDDTLSHPVWREFLEISRIPRRSCQEESVRTHIIERCQARNLATSVDGAGNLRVAKAASPGREMLPSVALQAHLDMVCVAGPSIEHDFDTDPIRVSVAGEWASAAGTTLGADNGIGVATILSILLNDGILHGPLEGIFTVREELDMGGARSISPDFVISRRLINVDAESLGAIYIGCAGGVDVSAKFGCSHCLLPRGNKAMSVDISGCKGGHSALDIDKGRANAIQVLATILYRAGTDVPMRLIRIDGGDLPNSIPRTACATIAVPAGRAHEFERALTESIAVQEQDLRAQEPDLKITLADAEVPESAWAEPDSRDLLKLLSRCRTGVYQRNPRFPDVVDISNNLGVVRTVDNEAHVQCLPRASSNEARDIAANELTVHFRALGAGASLSNAYPAWSPADQSSLRDCAMQSYWSLFCAQANAKIIHGGLECGFLHEKLPGLEAISIGATIENAHSADERVFLPSVAKLHDWIVEILRTI